MVIVATAAPALTQYVHQPGLEDSFPKPASGEDTIFQFNRLVLIRIMMVALVNAILFGVAAKAILAPGRGQMATELLAGFIRDNVTTEVLGPKRGRVYAGFIGFAFFVTLAMNLVGVIPGMNIAATSIVTVPAIFAIISYVTCVGSGVGALELGHFLVPQLLPLGLPRPMYLFITPTELLSNFIVHPVTLTVRLLASTVVGHFLLGMTYLGTALLFQELSALPATGIPTGVMVFITTGFEVFVTFLQAYIFTIPTSVCTKLSIESH